MWNLNHNHRRCRIWWRFCPILTSATWLTSQECSNVTNRLCLAITPPNFVRWRDGVIISTSPNWANRWGHLCVSYRPDTKTDSQRCAIWPFQVVLCQVLAWFQPTSTMMSAHHILVTRSWSCNTLNYSITTWLSLQSIAALVVPSSTAVPASRLKRSIPSAHLFTSRRMILGFPVLNDQLADRNVLPLLDPFPANWLLVIILLFSDNISAADYSNHYIWIRSSWTVESSNSFCRRVTHLRQWRLRDAQTAFLLWR